ncbi:phage portal protein [Pontibacillus yanchengensis]|uniref:Phage portal protein n=1 Tax=Pontibacillus yanchengensis TaxID=462910 RepID=A0A6I5A6M5_9BACI|nr:phage portal protein [Pontibacillus yanchengensis]MYL36026.1 phage portal protein [Pontibacillus yanchengensis]
MGKKTVGYVSGGKYIKGSLKSKVKTEESTQIIDKFQSNYGTFNVVLPKYNPSVLADLGAENTYHFKAVRAKADDGSGVGWELLKKEDEVDDDVKEKVESLIEESDINNTFRKAFTDLDTISFMTIEVARQGRLSNRRIDNIHHVPSEFVRVHRHRNKYVQMVGGEYVWFKRVGYMKDVDIKTGKEYPHGSLPIEQRANEMYFYSKYSSDSTVYGTSDAIPALGAIYGDINRRNYNLSYFETGGMATWAVMVTGDIPQGEEDDNGDMSYVHEDINDLIEQVGSNPHGVMVYSIPNKTTGGNINVEFQKLSDEQKEVSFRDFRIDNRDEILSAHGVPPQRLGISETGNLGGGNTEEVDAIYKSTMVEPLNGVVEEFMNKIWIPSLGVDGLKFRLKRRDEKGVEHDIENLKFLFDAGAMTSEEVRELFKDKYNLSDKKIEENKEKLEIKE